MQEDRNARSMCLREHWCVAVSRHLFPCGTRLRLCVSNGTDRLTPSTPTCLSWTHIHRAHPWWQFCRPQLWCANGVGRFAPFEEGCCIIPLPPLHPRSLLRLKLKSTERGRTPFDMHAVWPRLHINFSRDNAFVYRGWCSSLFSSVRTHARGNRCCFFRAQQ